MSNIVMETSKILFYEPILGKKFMSTIQEVNKALYNLNKIRAHYHDASTALNDWYELLGISSSAIGDAVRWNSHDMWGEISIVYQYEFDDNKPSIRLEYNYYPVWSQSDAFNKTYRRES